MPKPKLKPKPTKVELPYTPGISSEEADRFAKWNEVVFKSAADDMGMDVAALREGVDKILREKVDDADIFLRAPDGVLEKILDDGRIKSQFEVGGSQGILDIDLRRDMEDWVIGVPGTLSDSQRPVYGYLAQGDPIKNHGGEVGYGRVVFKARKGVRNRTTFTSGDSLDDEEMKAIMRLNDTFADGVNPDKVNMRALLDKNKLLQESVKGDYWEAQIHGGLSLADVEEVFIPHNHKQLSVVKKKAKDLGLRVTTYKPIPKPKPAPVPKPKSKSKPKIKPKPRTRKQKLVEVDKTKEGVIPTFKSAREADLWFSKTHGMSFDFSEANKAFVNDVGGKVHQILTKVPRLADEVKIKSFKGIISGDTGGRGFGYFDGKNIVINSTYTPKKLVRELKRGEGLSWFPKGTASTSSTTTHELGHLLEYNLTNLTKANTHVRQSYFELMDEWMDSKRIKSLETFSQGALSYAPHNQTVQSELFADAFSQIMEAPKSVWHDITKDVYDFLVKNDILVP
jgi:hypothetical protein